MADRLKKMDNRLREWVHHGFINEEQATLIRHFEQAQSSKSWMVYSFIALGASALGIGIIALVAANWMNIDDAVKLGVDLLLLVGLGGGIVYYLEKTRTVIIEVLLVSFILLCMASIGLVSQIYHLGGQLEDALLFWAAITLPVATLSRRYFIPFLWVSIVISAMVVRIMEQALLFPHRPDEVQWLALVLSLPFVNAILAAGLTRIPLLKSIGLGFRYWAFLVGAVGVLSFDLFIHFPSWQTKEFVMQMNPAFWLGIAVSMPVFMGVWWFSRLSSVRKKVVTLLMVFYLAMMPVSLMLLPYETMGAVFTCLILMTASVYAGLNHHRRLSNQLLLLTGFRFLGVYLAAIGGLVLSGVGLILTGVVILVAVALWNRHKHRLQQWIVGLEV